MGRGRDDSVLLISAALGALAGLRSMSAPALLSHEMSTEGDAHFLSRIERLLSSDRVANVLALLVGGEMLADKTSLVGNRTSAVPLLGRAIMGSFTAGAFAANRRQRVLLPAAIGAASAIASTYAAFHLRRLAAERFDVPDQVLGMIEDAIVVAAGKGLSEVIEL
jgi:uncharacterized membrane protein